MVERMPVVSVSDIITRPLVCSVSKTDKKLLSFWADPSRNEERVIQVDHTVQSVINTIQK